MFTSLLNLLLDAPFVVLAPLSLWRLPSVLKTVLKRSQEALDDDGSALLTDDVEATVEWPALQERTGDGRMDGHGLIVRLKGRARRLIDLRAARLTVEGDAFFDTLRQFKGGAAIVTTFKVNNYEFHLCSHSPTHSQTTPTHHEDDDATAQPVQQRHPLQ